MHLAKCIVLTATIFFTVPCMLDLVYVRGVKTARPKIIIIIIFSALGHL
jgi:hypothetical protein